MPYSYMGGNPSRNGRNGVVNMNLYDCKILLVDDNSELLAMTERILRKMAMKE